MFYDCDTIYVWMHNERIKKKKTVEYIYMKTLLNMNFDKLYVLNHEKFEWKFIQCLCHWWKLCCLVAGVLIVCLCFVEHFTQSRNKIFFFFLSLCIFSVTFFAVQNDKRDFLNRPKNKCKFCIVNIQLRWRFKWI